MDLNKRAKKSKTDISPMFLASKGKSRRWLFALLILLFLVFITGLIIYNMQGNHQPNYATNEVAQSASQETELSGMENIRGNLGKSKIDKADLKETKEEDNPLLRANSNKEKLDEAQGDASKPKAKEQTKAEQLLEKMTLEEKIGQLFIVRPSALQSASASKKQESSSEESHAEESNIEESHAEDGKVLVLDQAMEKALKKYSIGGVALFAQNIETPAQLSKLTKGLQAQSAIPLLIALDEEGGLVSRIANAENFQVPRFESMEKIGETGSAARAKEVGTTIGSYLKTYGFNLDFAPVADINTNPENIVIGNRSFGSDPQLVATMVSAEVSGLHEAGVMSCIKHFPGHGDTKGDTHDGYVSVQKTWTELKACELVPFIEALGETDLVMIAHITTPNVTTDGLPASLSAQMVSGKLRDELGYNGVVITDALEMAAITKAYASSQCAVKAILAGVDILLMPEDFVEAYNGIYEAVKRNEVSEARIDESVLRILSLKEKYHLI